ncbi:LLM class flavin-dependent oxidoreductase [Pseudonocardia sp.]|uniref:LLM class flavin-dependent oxidoreductase n=1 Tax=Pseudonocardia sp. TaxID=60912 RepID=UPI003D1529BD
MSLHLAVALDATGWHPASWREPGARAGELFTAGYWTDLVLLAQRGLLDLVTIEDGYGMQAPDDRTDQVRGRLDATLVAARVAPATSGIGIVPTAVVTHSEPFHISKAIATLDYVSAGRAGVRVRVTGRPDEAALFGRRAAPDRDELFAEAGDAVEVLRRLWDSWEDDAEIRDTATGRFVDREKLHYIDFEGRFFSVRGPSITPRPPQGQPIVAALAHVPVAFRLVGTHADVGFVTPQETADIPGILGAIHAAREIAGRDTVHVLGDLLVVLDPTAEAAAARLDRLDTLAGAELTSDARIVAGTPAQLADLIEEWHAAGLSGVRLRPATHAHDLPLIVDALVPELQRRGLHRTAYEAATLRGLLGLSRPANRYADQV